MRNISKRARLYALALVLALSGLAGGIAYAATTQSATCTGGTVTYTTTAAKFTSSCSVPLPPRQTVTATATVTATVTAQPAPSQTPAPVDSPAPTTTAPAPTTTPTAAPASGTWSCVLTELNTGCPTKAGPNGESGYADTSFSPNSNGWNTYVNNQDVGYAGSGTETLYANGARSWQVVANLGACGGCVQTFPATQQLFNSSGSATKISDLSELKVNYDETSPGGSANGYEFAPDLWQTGYPWDVMWWVDTNLRCNDAGPVIGKFTMDGQGWTAHMYGGTPDANGVPQGGEIILILDGPGGSGTCATQSKGTINIKASLEWLASKGFIPASPAVMQLNTGWEITQAKNATFTLNDLTYTVTPK